MRYFILFFISAALTLSIGCPTQDFTRIKKEVNEGQEKVNELYKKVQKYKELWSEVRTQTRLTLELYYGTEDIKGIREIAIENKDKYTEKQWERFKKADEQISEFKGLAKKLDQKVSDIFVRIERGKAQADEWFNKLNTYIDIARNLNESINDVIHSAED